MCSKLNFKDYFKLKRRKGSALAFVLIILLGISILTTSLLYIFNTNLKQAKYQQDRIEAYYLAYSGAEMAYSALLTKKSDGRLKLTDLTPGNELTQRDISYGNGKIDISAKISKDENFDGWIKITATGTLNKNNLSYTRSLFFDPANPVNKMWKND